MNLGLITSFIVGGMLLLSMVALSSRISQNSGNTTLDFVAKSNVSTVSEILQADMRRLGFGVSGTAITSMSATQITFQSTFNTDSTVTITWAYFPTDSVMTTENPDDRPLRRTVNGVVTDIPMVVTNFTLAYTDAAGNATATPANVRNIRVSITCESAFSYGDYYGLGYWEGIITPRAIQ